MVSERYKILRKKYKRLANRRITCIFSARYEKFIDSLSEKQIEEIQDFYFNTPPGFLVDHLIPLSKGGTHCIENLRYVTHMVNIKKGSRLPVEIENPRKNDMHAIVTYKFNWGKDLFYPENEDALFLTKLIGSKSLMKRHLQICQDNGWKITIKQMDVKEILESDQEYEYKKVLKNADK